MHDHNMSHAVQINTACDKACSKFFLIITIYACLDSMRWIHSVV